MLIGDPPRTPYDLNFHLFGFPVRVHPAFFVMPLVFGSNIVQLAGNAGVGILIVTAVFFLSILVHELGHAFAFRYYGIDSYIVLYWMGGVAVPTGTTWGRGRRSTRNAQIVISLAGPAFGFCLAAVFVGLVYLVGGVVSYMQDGLFPMLVPNLNGTAMNNGAMRLFFFTGVWANVVWNILNLIPVYPLDGGQVARELFQRYDGAMGVRNSIYFSIVVGVGMALYGMMNQDMFLAILFGMLAYSNYMMVQGPTRPMW